MHIPLEAHRQMYRIKHKYSNENIPRQNIVSQSIKIIYQSILKLFID